MTKTPSRIVLTTVLILAAVSTALAQRGGGYGFRQSYSGNTRYDGKFVFVRMSYPTNTFRNPGWAHDYPDGEVHFMKILTTVSNVQAHVEETNILDFGDPEMFKFPVIYLVEPGYWQMNEEQAKALRAYLMKGGFMIVDDFPSWAWQQFDLQMSAVFPQGQWIDLEDASHPIFHSFFEIDSLDLIPQAYFLGGPPRFRALFEDNDPNKRMLVIANYQSDLSEFWEFSEVGIYPIDASNKAYKLGVNEFVYGMTH
jgi:Domain of unknown function (DUF4159)